VFRYLLKLAITESGAKPDMQMDWDVPEEESTSAADQTDSLEK
jgi:hypothetical protein